VLEKLPPEAGNLTVLESNQLSAAQKVAKLIRRLPIVLVLVMALFYGAAIYLARGRRREVVRAVGFGFLVAGVAALAVRGLAGDAVVGALASTDAVKPAVESVWGIGTSLLVEIAVSTILFGVLLVLGAWLLGGTAAARAVRRQTAPWLRERPAVAYLSLGLILLALIAWVPIAAFRTWLGVLVFAILFAVGAAIFRRETLSEFPDAPRQTFGATLRSLRQRAPREASAASADPVEQLERLDALRASGALSPEEFEAAKSKILAAP
jgi:hypothetical protein